MFVSHSQASVVEKGVAAAQNGDFELARKLWLEGAVAGDTIAMTNLGGLFLSDALGEPNPHKAREWFLKSAQRGEPRASISLGYMYERGLGVDIDLATAESYFNDAALAGSLDGLFEHSRLILSRESSNSETRKALANLNAAAKQHHPRALTTVGDLLRSGTFTEKDPLKALEYYKTASAAGNVEAMSKIGDIYMFAELGEADIDTALFWYEKAATAGVIDAAYAIANIFYYQTDSGDEELSKAFDYAKLGAVSWHESSQLLLGKMYIDGVVAPVDFKKAYFWLDLASSAGTLEAHYLRAIAESSLSRQEVMKARKEAEIWFAQNHSKPHVHRLINNNMHTLR